ERKLYPNVDFYSGVIYRAIGIPVPMFTVLFAMGRLPGWISHWLEMHQNKNTKICRPRQIYVGAPKRDFLPMDKRRYFRSWKCVSEWVTQAPSSSYTIAVALRKADNTSRSWWTCGTTKPIWS